MHRLSLNSFGRQKSKLERKRQFLSCLQRSRRRVWRREIQRQARVWPRVVFESSLRGWERVSTPGRGRSKDPERV